jgi:predicted lipoprotein with Yx(FWY)xxD motif
MISDSSNVGSHRPRRLKFPRRRTTLLVSVAALAVSLAAVGVPAATAAPVRTDGLHAAVAHAKKPPIVVRAATRKGFGKILVAAPGGATLYRDSNDGPNDPTCTGSCASIWPPLVLPAGDTTPRGGPGVTGLGTVTLADGDLQVTYNSEPLYTFTGDSGHSVNGNGVGPFLVVKKV